MRRPYIIVSLGCIFFVALLVTLGIIFLIPRKVDIIDAQPNLNISSAPGGELRGTMVAKVRLINNNFVPVTLSGNVVFYVEGCNNTLGEGILDRNVLSPRRVTGLTLLGTINYDPRQDQGYCVLRAISNACPTAGISLVTTGTAHYSTWIKSGTQALKHTLNVDCATLRSI
jgi:hypothetical protein